jgi:hypothetical protein
VVKGIHQRRVRLTFSAFSAFSSVFFSALSAFFSTFFSVYFTAALT